MQAVGCPNGLSALGYSHADIPEIVEGAWKQQRLLAVSPRTVTKQDLRSLVEESMVLW
jgi:alcohol dehydrogenase class IV